MKNSNTDNVPIRSSQHYGPMKFSETILNCTSKTHFSKTSSIKCSLIPTTPLIRSTKITKNIDLCLIRKDKELFQRKILRMKKCLNKLWELTWKCVRAISRSWDNYQDGVHRSIWLKLILKQQFLYSTTHLEHSSMLLVSAQIASWWPSSSSRVVEHSQI
jgi:hypothetical protein